MSMERTILGKEPSLHDGVAIHLAVLSCAPRKTMGANLRRSLN